MKMKYLIITLIVAFLMVCCSGCSKQKEDKLSEIEDKLSKDIHIEDKTGNYFHEQTIATSSNNGYRCIYSNIDFNEEDKQYIITFKFGIPIEEE